MSKRLTLQDFIEKSCAVHGQQYDYSAVEYKGNKTKVRIRCKKHDSLFFIVPSSHMRGSGCSKCGYEKVSESLSSNVQEFIKKATFLHGDRYDYSRVEYKGSTTKVDLYCNKHNTMFSMSPTNHLSGQGCPTCGIESAAKLHTRDTEQFVGMAQQVHGALYDYASVEYTKSEVSVEIGCRSCGEMFQQKPAAHLAGHGCNKCGYARGGLTGRLGKFRFILQAEEVHGTKYDYSLVEYELGRVKVQIGCKVCGSYFLQTPENHLGGAGCPKCGKGGYSSVAPGIFYILKCGDITKVGITNRSPKRRATRVSKSFGSEFAIFRTWYFEDGQVPLMLETKVLRELKISYKNPSSKFEGYTECFLGVDAAALVTNIELKLDEIAQRSECCD